MPSLIDIPLKFNEKSILILQTQKFDLLLDFDKEISYCALTELVRAKEKKGFTLINGKCAPINKDAVFKYEIGLNDKLASACKKSYPEQILEIAG